MWYIAKLIYRITCGSGAHQPQFDEQLRLLEAEDEAAAFARAIAIGRSGEDRFVNQDEQLVSWTFVDVAELIAFEGTLDGAELYSQVRETEDAPAYVNFVHYKSHCIRERLTATNERLVSIDL
ncbi:DUF4288 domain-containing protein [Flaviaesturariibacter flavus]|uniref:DUF4288 domain-containing protein n=1 Tax=Flaviaesturariibacter flavus TaxID=2502780 RepID=A0A4R1BMR6_9BACT|nr:DUF4288 domain-containing protein [Flaviaesturariibacter flavus]TCJ18618.1 DUF4288 domain-containing protein [Flaviaesturariibacter flavus]